MGREDRSHYPQIHRFLLFLQFREFQRRKDRGNRLWTAVWSKFDSINRGYCDARRDEERGTRDFSHRAAIAFPSGGKRGKRGNHRNAFQYTRYALVVGDGAATTLLGALLVEIIAAKALQDLYEARIERGGIILNLLKSWKMASLKE